MSIRSTAFSVIFGFVLMLYLSVLHLQAQPVVSASNLALGGGGAAYLSGFESNFYNPANLMVYDRKARFHFGAGNAGGYFLPVLSTENVRDQASRFKDIYSPYTPGSRSVSVDERNVILDRHFPKQTLTSQHQSRADIIWGGIHWQGDKQAYSLTARTRIGTRTETGRGWYSFEFIEQGDKSVRDFHLTVQSQVLHEISLGFAYDFEFINGLLPRINKLYIGLAPKFIMGGAFRNTSYNAHYENRVNMAPDAAPEFISSFTHHSSGNYSEMIKRYRATRNLQTSIDQHMDEDFFLTPTGYGLGIDFGLTYLIPLGSDVSILDKGEDRRPITKSLRVALSVTDLGLVYYQSSPLNIKSDPDTTQAGNQDPLLSKFVGSPGQFAAFFEDAQMLSNPILNPNEPNEEAYSSLLPTSINAGAMLDLNRLKLMSDITLALNKTAYAGTQLTAHLGMEIRPLPFIPLRMGTTLAAGTPVRVGLGTGINTRNWNFSISSQVLLRKGSITSEVTGGAIAGFQFHL